MFSNNAFLNTLVQMNPSVNDNTL